MKREEEKKNVVEQAAEMSPGMELDQVKVVYINVNGLRNKHRELIKIAERNEWDVTFVCESRLKETHVLWCPNGWRWVTSPLQCPSVAVASGGVACLLSARVAELAQVVNDQERNHLFIDLGGWRLGVGYLRPSGSRAAARSFFDIASKVLEGRRCLFGGDFNARLSPDANNDGWDSNTDESAFVIGGSEVDGMANGDEGAHVFASEEDMADEPSFTEITLDVKH